MKKYPPRPKKGIVVMVEKSCFRAYDIENDILVSYGTDDCLIGSSNLHYFIAIILTLRIIASRNNMHNETIYCINQPAIWWCRQKRCASKTSNPVAKDLIVEGLKRLNTTEINRRFEFWNTKAWGSPSLSRF